VAGLRKALTDGGTSLRTRAPGYVLELEAGSLDLDRFTQLCREARESSVPEHRAALLHEALRLWRDEPLPELRNEPFAGTAVGQLEQLRLGALEERIDADLTLGRDAELVPELETLVAEHRYRERLRAQLMLALYRSGRQADALDAYQVGRRVLQEELGLEPGKELRDLEAAILRQDEALSPARADTEEPEPGPPPSSLRFSRRTLIAAGVVGFALIALAATVAAFRSTGTSDAGISPGSVGVVDSSSRSVVAEIPVGFSSPLIAAGEGFVWVVDPEGRTLTSIDPETNTIFAPPRGIPGDGVPIALAVGEGSVWIALNEGRVLSVLKLGPEFGDRRHRTVLETSDRQLEPPFEPVELAIGDGAVWAFERGGGEINRIDPETGEKTLFADGYGGSSSIAVSGHALWLGGPDGVKKIDLRTRKELSAPPPKEVEKSRITSIAVRPEAVWFVGETGTRLWRIDPVRVAIQSSEPIGASPSDVAVDAQGAVWVASSSLTSLARYDPGTNRVDRVDVGTTSRGLVARFGRIWTSPGAAAD
jgi:streptogramin lyase